MITVDHLLDDAALGGVTRFIEALTDGLAASTRQTSRIVSPHSELPPALTSDVVVVHFTLSWAKLPYLLALRARQGARPIVLVEHSYCEGFARSHVSNPARFQMLLRLGYSLVDHVVAVSYGQAAWMRRERLLAASKLSVIPPFTKCEDLGALPFAAAHIVPLRLGAYGRYCAQKDFATLIAAMQRIDPAVATLSLRGFGPDEAALVQQAAGLPHVTVGDRIMGLSDYLGGVDVIAVPSRFEPFGQVALEARLAGRPVIVTAVDGLPEQVEPGAGLVVPSGDAAALAAAIVALAAVHADGGLANMAAAARQSATGHILSSQRRWQHLLGRLQVWPDVQSITAAPAAGAVTHS